MGTIFSRCFDIQDSKHIVDANSEGGITNPNASNGPESQELPKSYSWDRRREEQKKEDPTELIFDGLEGQIVGKCPGRIKGRQFVIQNCKNCHIYLFDHTSSVNIDDCTDCKILVGPCKASVSFRDCTNCNLIAICQQFRTRDCRNCNIFLHCTTKPAIESSSAMHFACLQLNYAGLKTQYNTSGLSVFNNLWSDIYDFTPVAGASNHSILPDTTDPLDYVPVIETDEDTWPKLKPVSESVVPLSLGSRPRTPGETAFVLLFTPAGKEAQPVETEGMRLLDALKTQDLKLVRTKHIRMTPADAERVFQSNSHNPDVERGPVISIEAFGPDGRQKLLTGLVQLSPPLCVLVPEDGAHTETLMHAFYTFADMKMGL